MSRSQSLRVLVTGGTGALGAAVCRAFLEQGAQVVALGLRAAPEFAAGFGEAGARLSVLAADLGDLAGGARGVDEAARLLGGLDALCNIAGGFEMGPFATFSAEQMEEQFTINFRSAYVATQAALPHLARQQGGKIVFVASRAALGAAPGLVAYAASKSALLSMSRSLAAELLPQGIQVNAVLPSIIDTPANRAAMAGADFSAWPKPDEIARVIWWLCSSEADLVSGAEIPVYGRA